MRVAIASRGAFRARTRAAAHGRAGPGPWASSDRQRSARRAPSTLLAGGFAFPPRQRGRKRLSAAVNAPDIVAIGALVEEDLAVAVDLDHARLPVACDQEIAVGQPLGVIGVGKVVLPVHLPV